MKKIVRFMLVGMLTFPLIIQAQVYYPDFHGSTSMVDNAIGTRTFSNLNNCFASDNIYTSSNSGLISLSTVNSNYLVVSGFNFNMPPGLTVYGIEVTIEKRASGLALGSSITDNSVRLVKDGVILGDDKALPGNWSTSDMNSVYGSTTDLWGTTWTTDDLNDPDFGVAISASFSAGLVSALMSAQIDDIRLTVHIDRWKVEPKDTETATMRKGIKNDDLVIFPTPSNGIINFASSRVITNIQLYNITGQLIQNIDNSSTTFKFNNLDRGIYFVKTRLADDSIISKKFVVR